MQDVENIRKQLEEHAKKISQEQGGPPVVVIIAGSANAGVPACITAWANLGQGREGRLRDLLGILQTAIQIESLKHLKLQKKNDTPGR